MFNSVADQLALVKEIVKNKVTLDQILTGKDHSKIEEIVTQEEIMNNFTSLKDYFQVVNYFMNHDYQPTEVTQMVTMLGKMNNQLTKEVLSRYYDVKSGNKTYQNIFRNLEAGNLKDPVQELADWYVVTYFIEEPRVSYLLTESVFDQKPCSDYLETIYSEDHDWIQSFVTNYKDPQKRKDIINQYHKCYRPQTYQKKR